jgi:CheY-like chemotaxis protein
MLEFPPSAQPIREAPDFLAGGGEMGERMRALQWTRTALGAPADWPPPLRQALRLVLASRQPMSLWWGDALVHLYNDACRLLLGRNHPSALGMRAEVVWGEWWDALEPRADAAIRRHEGSATPPLLFLVEHQGQPLESHFTMSALAVPGERGAIGGVLWTFTDVTAAVLREREMASLAAVRRAVRAAADVRQVCVRACHALSCARHDLPFAALYAVEGEGREARLVARCGVGDASETLPEALMLGDACAWPLAAANASRVRLDDPRFGRLPQGPWERPPKEALIVPVAPLEGGAMLVLVAGLNPHRTVDEPLERFVDLLGGEIAAALDAARRASAGRQEAQPVVPARLRKRILVADDNPDSAETLQIMLEMMGNEVRVARDGEEAVRAAAELAPDAILMDIGMPKLNGYDACARIRAAGSDAFIVALTGWSQEEDKARSKEAGFDQHLVKPVEPNTLESLIRAIK